MYGEFTNGKNQTFRQEIAGINANDLFLDTMSGIGGESPARADFGATGDQVLRGSSKRTKSVPIINTTKAPAEGDVVYGERMNVKRQTGKGRCRALVRRGLSAEVLLKECPWAGDKKPTS